MSDIPAAMDRTVRERAGDRCEYCGLSQLGQEAVFHIDHVEPRAANGATELDSLALACVSCSLRKGARQTAADPDTGADTPLFDPRRDNWWVHFRSDADLIVGLTAVGRATVSALQLNRSRIKSIRVVEIMLGRFPPPAWWAAGIDDS